MHWGKLDAHLAYQEIQHVSYLREQCPGDFFCGNIVSVGALDNDCIFLWLCDIYDSAYVLLT